MKKGCSVELIPWLHHYFVLPHREIVRFVGALPKGSVFAMELDRPILQFWHRIQAARGSETEKVFDGIMADVKAGYTSDFGAVAAALELLFECEKRSIRVMPLAAHVFSGKYSSESNSKEYKMAKELATEAKKMRRGKIIALAGLNHIDGIKAWLARSGVDSKANFKVFPWRTPKLDLLSFGSFYWRRKISAAMRSERKVRKAERKGDVAKAERMKTKNARLLSQIGVRLLNDSPDFRVFKQKLVERKKKMERRWRQKAGVRTNPSAHLAMA